IVPLIPPSMKYNRCKSATRRWLYTEKYLIFLASPCKSAKVLRNLEMFGSTRNYFSHRLSLRVWSAEGVGVHYLGLKRAVFSRSRTQILFHLRFVRHTW